NEGTPAMQTGVEEEAKATIQGEPNGERKEMSQEESEDEYNSITVLPEPATEPEHPTIRDDMEPEQADPRILLQNTGPEQRASGRPNKGTFKTKDKATYVGERTKQTP